jgi:hypothetical protein
MTTEPVRAHPAVREMPEGVAPGQRRRWQAHSGADDLDEVAEVGF